MYERGSSRYVTASDKIIPKFFFQDIYTFLSHILLRATPNECHAN